MRRVPVLLALTILVGLAFIPPANAKSSKTYEVGDTVTTSFGFKVKLIGVEDPWTPWTAVNPSEAAPGSRYVVLDVRVKNTKPKTQLFDPAFGLRLFDPQQQHTFTLDTTGCTGLELGPPQGQMQPEQVMRGFLCFSVPKSVKHPRLQLAGARIGDRVNGFVFKLS
jgi:hypothetical protein